MNQVVSNDDILSEILLRLPTKSVHRFKLVSKRWLSLIANPNFAMSHSRRNPNKVFGLVAFASHFKEPPRYVYIPFDGKSNRVPTSFLKFDPNAPGPMLVLHSCNGLLLCRSIQYSPIIRYSNNTYDDSKHYIFNPTTKQFTSLPSPLGMDLNRIQLAFDPLKSSHYWVIGLKLSILELEWQILIYSSVTKVWKALANDGTIPFPKNVDNGVFWNGGMHWMSSTGDSLRLEVDEEHVKAMPRPPVPNDWDPSKNFMYFGASYGHLHFIGFNGQYPSQYMVFEMEGDCSKWFLKYSLSRDPILKAHPEMISSQNYFHPLSGLGDNISILSLIDGEDEGPFVVMRAGTKVISYNFKEKTFKKLCDSGWFRVSKTGLFQYIEMHSCFAE